MILFLLSGEKNLNLENNIRGVLQQDRKFCASLILWSLELPPPPERKENKASRPNWQTQNCLPINFTDTKI